MTFYEVVMTKKQENESAYLVTGNLKHFPQKSFTMTPKDFLDILSR